MTTNQLIRLLIAIAVIAVLIWLIIVIVGEIDDETAGVVRETAGRFGTTVGPLAVGTMDGGGRWPW